MQPENHTELTKINALAGSDGNFILQLNEFIDFSEIKSQASVCM